MRKRIIIGNWKMHGSITAVQGLLTDLREQCLHTDAVEWVVCPPVIYLPLTQQLLTKTGIAWGAQNVYCKKSGPYTGEIAPSMLIDYGCQYVIIGHSERRQRFAETDSLIQAKLCSVMQAGLTPILCVGETLESRKANRVAEVITKQISVLSALQQDVTYHLNSGECRLIIAYEPVWAIGTGEHATPSQAQAVHRLLRDYLAKIDQKLANAVRIIYGGSVNSTNAAALFAEPDIDGGLIGRASLNATQFSEIGNVCSLSY